MRLSHLRCSGPAAATILLLLTACGGAPVDTSIPIDEARLVNGELAGAYVRTRDLLEESAETSRRLATLPPEVNAADLDADQLRHVLEACYTQTIDYRHGVDMDALPRRAEAQLGADHRPLTDRVEVGRVRACQPARMIALEAYLDVVDRPTRAFILDRVLVVDALRVNLKDVLVAQVDALERTAAEARAALMRLREVSAERRAVAQTSSDLTEEERRRVEVDFETISQELDQVESVLEQVDEEISDMRQLRRQLVEEAARNIAMMGL
jgi:DNA repair exonuclease SbcCD ATPase subunit